MRWHRVMEYKKKCTKNNTAGQGQKSLCGLVSGGENEDVNFFF